MLPWVDEISVAVWYVTTVKYARRHVGSLRGRTTMVSGACRTGFGLNFLDAAEMTQNPVNFAARLSIIYRIQSIFVKYAQRRLNRTASEMCA
jgi:hypothetical protein